MATATVTYRAELADLRKKLESITDVTRAEARKMVAELDKSMKALDRQNSRTAKSFRGVGDSVKSAADQVKEVGESAGDAESSIRAISGAIGMVNPEAEKMLNVFAELGGATEGVTRGSQLLGVATLPALTAALTAAGVAALALGAAYVVLSSRLEDAEAKAASNAKVAGQLGKAHGDLEKTVGAVDEEWQKTLGTYDAIGAAEEKRNRDIERNAAAERRAAGAVVEAAKQRLAAAEGIEEVRAAEAGLARARQQHTRILAGVNRDEREALRKSGEIAEYARERAESEESLRKRLEASASATQAKSGVDAEALQLERERAAALSQLLGIQQSASLSVLEGEERLTEELRRQLEAINDLERASGDAAAASEARQAVAIEYEHRVARIREQEAEKAAQMDAKRAQDVEKQRQEAMHASIDLASMATSQLSEGFGAAYDYMLEDVARLQDYQAQAEEHLTEAQNAELAKRIEAQKRAARNAFEAQQAAAAAEAAINTALAIGKAATAAPPPLNIPLMALAAAQGIAQQRSIAKAQPSFHSGGAADYMPDETSAKVLRNEFVITSTGRQTLGDDTLHKANAGQPSAAGGREVYVVNQYKHDIMVDRWKRDGLDQGDPIARRIQRGQRIGHRTVR
jgi:hypothetical protein